MTDREYQALYDEVYKALVTMEMRSKLAALTAFANDPTIERLTAERDSALAAYNELLHSRSKGTRIAFEMAEAAKAERDSARQQLATVRAERDGAAAWRQQLRDAVVRETAEAIAAYFESIPEKRGSQTVGPLMSCSEIAAAIRAWRTTKGDASK
jgi:hypothetical protein